MEPYFIIFFILSFLSIWDSIGLKIAHRRIFLLLSAILLVLFAALRFETPDWIEYRDAFLEIVEVGYNYSRFEKSAIFEPLYNLTAYIVSLFTANPTIHFFVIAAIAVGLNLSFYSRYSKYFLLTLLFYFVHTYLFRETMQIRSGVAAAIVLWSLRYVFRQRFIKFSLLVSLATGFHIGAALFFIIYPIYRFNWSRKVWLYIIAFSIFFAIFLPFGKIIILMPTGGIFQRILVYSWMMEASQGSVFTNPTILKQLLLVVVALRYWSVLEQKMDYFRLFITPLMISLCWLLVWNDFTIVAARIATFFSVTEVMLMPMFFYLVTPKSRPIVGLILILIAFAILGLNIAVDNFAEYNFI